VIQRRISRLSYALPTTSSSCCVEAGLDAGLGSGLEALSTVFAWLGLGGGHGASSHLTGGRDSIATFVRSTFPRRGSPCATGPSPRKSAETPATPANASYAGSPNGRDSSRMELLMS